MTRMVDIRPILNQYPGLFLDTREAIRDYKRKEISWHDVVLIFQEEYDTWFEDYENALSEVY